MTNPTNATSRTIALRPVQAGDEPFLLAVYGSSREEEMALVPWDDAQKEMFIRMQATAQHQYYQAEYPRAEYLVILADGEPVGRLYVDRRPHEIRILDLTLLTPYRGQGIGTPLLDALMTEAANAAKTLNIYLDAGSRSQSLFARLGFKPVSDSGAHVLFEWQAPSSSNGQT